jgi:hypothetical protein
LEQALLGLLHRQQAAQQSAVQALVVISTTLVEYVEQGPVLGVVVPPLY